MKKIKLPSVKIISIVNTDDDKYIDLTLKSLIATLESIETDDPAIIIFPPGVTLTLNVFYLKNKYNVVFVPHYEVTLYSYSYYISRYLNLFVKDTPKISHVLVHQWDSCVINPDLWTDDFLNYDYIGAPWPFLMNYHNEFNSNVYQGNVLIGNGGFSLRSKDFIEYTEKLSSQPYNLIPRHSTLISDNEDILTCVKYQHVAEHILKRKLRFPSLDLARQFSVERQFPTDSNHHHDYDDLPSYKSFGFHGDFNKAGMEYINNMYNNTVIQYRI